MFVKSQTIKKSKELYKGKGFKENWNDSQEKLPAASLESVSIHKERRRLFTFLETQGKEKGRNIEQMQYFLAHKIRVLCLKG